MSINGFYIDGKVEKYNYDSLDNLPTLAEATDEEIMDTMAELEMIVAVTTFSGAILISNNNEIYSL
jgi:hypothetical protein